MAHQTTLTPPDNVAQIAATHQLGTFAEVYQAAQGLRAAISGCLIFVSSIPCIIFFTLLRIGQLTGWIVLLLVVCAALFGTLGYMLQGSQAGGSAVYLFEHGIVYSQKGQYTPLSWPQIASCEIRQGFRFNSSERCIVSTKDGHTFPIGNLTAYKELEAIIEDAIEPR